jgi:hypothetical protein
MLGMGHNNDQGMCHRTKFFEWLEERGLKVLGDRGYRHVRVITPDTLLHDKDWNDTQKGFRSVVESVAGYAKCWGFANARCRISPELQEIGLLIIYHFVARLLRDFPLRPLLE